MKISYVFWMSRDEDRSLRVVDMHVERLEKKGHIVDKMFLQEHRMGNFFQRRWEMMRNLLSFLVRMKNSDVIILMHPYCFTWSIPIIRMFCGKYVVETADTQDMFDVLRYSTPWYKRPPFWCHYIAWLVFMWASSGVRCTTHKAARIASKLGVKHVAIIYEVYTEGIVSQKKVPEKVIIGCILSTGTECFYSEYVPTIRQLADMGVRFEFVGCSPEFAKLCGAHLIDWSPNVLKEIPSTWTFGLALLPSKSKFDGRLHGKILQYMAANIPTIATPQGETPHLFLDNIDHWNDKIEEFLIRARK